MAINDFYPFQPNQKITLEQWNELFDAIRTGAFFLDSTPISEAIASLAQRVSVLEQEMNFVKQLRGRNWAKHQQPLTHQQNEITFSKPPVTDSELVYLNGVYLSKTKVDEDFIGDYSIDGATITLHPDIAMNIVDGDILSATYQFTVHPFEEPNEDPEVK